MRTANLFCFALLTAFAGCGPGSSATEPGDDSWRTLPQAPLSARGGHSAVWTGKEVLVWGGSVMDVGTPGDERREAGYTLEPSTGKTKPLVVESYADGAAYDPVARSWRKLPPSPLAPRSGHTAVWTGKEMLIWQGTNLLEGFSDGAAYDPAADSWRKLPRAPFTDLPAWSAVWTGRELVLWGGMDHQPDLPAKGAAYDPELNRWRVIAPSPLRARQWHSAVWTGKEMIVWGGTDLVRTPDFADGAAYDPGTDTWRALSAAPIAGRYRHDAIWTEREMIVWGGQVGPLDANDGAAYDPLKNTWRRLRQAPLAGRYWPSMLWTGHEAMVWGGYQFDELANSRGAFADGAAYSPATDRWRLLPEAPLTGRCHHASVWNGEDFLVWGGEKCGDIGHYWADGAAYRPGPSEAR